MFTTRYKNWWPNTACGDVCNVYLSDIPLHVPSKLCKSGRPDPPFPMLVMPALGKGAVWFTKLSLICLETTAVMDSKSSLIQFVWLQLNHSTVPLTVIPGQHITYPLENMLCQRNVQYTVLWAHLAPANLALAYLMLTESRTKTQVCSVTSQVLNAVKRYLLQFII